MTILQQYLVQVCWYSLLNVTDGEVFAGLESQYWDTLFMLGRLNRAAFPWALRWHRIAGASVWARRSSQEWGAQRGRSQSCTGAVTLLWIKTPLLWRSGYRCSAFYPLKKSSHCWLRLYSGPHFHQGTGWGQKCEDPSTWEGHGWRTTDWWRPRCLWGCGDLR